MKYLLPILLIATISFSCKSKKGNTTGDPTSKEIKTNLVVLDSYEKLAPHLETDNDTTYVVNFWATWCKPCVAELPYFMKAAQHFGNKKVAFRYVSLDFKSQIDSKLKPFIKKGKIEGEIIAITDNKFNNWIDKVSKTWTGSIPATLIFTKDKRGFYEQSFKYEELESTIEEYLK